MQIHELPLLGTAPTSSDFIPVDDGTKTYKAPADGLGITTQMTQAEAAAGTGTDPRVITPSIFKLSVDSLAETVAETVADQVTDDGITAATRALYTALGWVDPTE